MAESEKVDFRQLIDDRKLVEMGVNAKLASENMSLLVKSLKDLNAENAKSLKEKKGNSAVSLKEELALIEKTKRERLALQAVEQKQAIFEENLSKLRKKNAAELEQQQQKQSKSTKDLNDAESKELGTLEKLIQANKALAAERKKLNLDTDAGKNRLIEINKELDSNNTRIRENSDTLGKQKINIGNYQSALNGLPRAFNLAADGAVQFGSGLKALLLNPVVLIISAISAALYGLFKAFTSTDTGANEFAAIMKSMSAILDIIRQRVILVTGAIGDLFNGDVTAASQKFKESISGVSDELETATKAARDYVFAIDAIEDSENNYISTRAENQRKIAELEFKAADKSFTIEQRRKFLEEAIKLSEEDFAKTRDIARAKFVEELSYFAKINKLNKLELKEFITASDEQQALASKDLKRARENNEEKFKQLEELYAAIYQAETDFFNENKRNNAKIAAFDEQVQAARLKAKEDELKKREKQLKDMQELWKKAEDEVDKALADEQRIRDIDDANAKKIQKAKEKLEKDIADNEKWVREQKAKIEEEKRAAKIHSIQEQISDTQRILQATQQALDAENKLREDALNTQISQREKAVNRQFELAKEGLSNQYAWEQEQLAKDQLKKKDLLKREAREREAIQLSQAYLNAYNAELTKPGANPTTAGALALKDVLLAKAIGSGIAALASYFDGTEDTGSGGDIDGKGGFLTINHPNERIVNAAGNKKIKESAKGKTISNDKLVDIAVKYNKGELVDVTKKYDLSASKTAVDSYANELLYSEFKKQNDLLQKIADKPVQMFDIRPFHNRLDILETIVRSGKVDEIMHKGKTHL